MTQRQWYTRVDVWACVLGALVYLNLSEALVREYGVPSLLQGAVLVTIGILWAHGERLRPALSSLTLTVLLVVMAALVFATSVYARDRSIADERTIDYLKMLGIYLVIAAALTNRVAVVRLAWTIVAAGTLLSSLALFQVFTGEFDMTFSGLARIKHAHIYGTEFEPRIAGPLGDPNFFAQVLIPLVPIAALIAWHARSRRARAAALAAAATIATCIVFTYSRGAAVALAVVALLTVVAARPRWHQLGAMALAALAIAVLIPSDFLLRVTTIEQLLPGSENVEKPDSSFEKRRLLVAVAWHTFSDRPLLGVGAGNYTMHFDDYAPIVGSTARGDDDPAEPHYPHSLYLELAAEMGIVGLTLFLACLATAWVYLRRAWQTFEARGDAFAGALARAAAIGIAGYALCSIFLHGHFMRYLWLLFAFAVGLYRVSGYGLMIRRFDGDDSVTAGFQPS